MDVLVHRPLKLAKQVGQFQLGVSLSQFGHTCLQPLPAGRNDVKWSPTADSLFHPSGPFKVTTTHVHTTVGRPQQMPDGSHMLSRNLRAETNPIEMANERILALPCFLQSLGRQLIRQSHLAGQSVPYDSNMSNLLRVPMKSRPAGNAHWLMMTLQ